MRFCCAAFRRRWRAPQHDVNSFVFLAMFLGSGCGLVLELWRAAAPLPAAAYHGARHAVAAAARGLALVWRGRRLFANW